MTKFASCSAWRRRPWSWVLSLAGGVANADDRRRCRPPCFNTQCSLDQLMAATKVVDPIATAIVAKYNSGRGFRAGCYHFNLFPEVAAGPPGGKSTRSPMYSRNTFRYSVPLSRPPTRLRPSVQASGGQSRSVGAVVISLT